MWHCSVSGRFRKEIRGTYTGEFLNEQPSCLLLCGIIPDDTKLDDFFATLATNTVAPEERPLDAYDTDDGDLSYDSEEFLQVAGDGACPAGQDNVRTRTAGCGLWYGENHNLNSAWALEGSSKGAQRVEIRAAARLAAWSWCKQVYITDSMQVFKGGEPFLQRSQ